jgi:hypothetical protein
VNRNLQSVARKSAKGTSNADKDDALHCCSNQ